MEDTETVDGTEQNQNDAAESTVTKSEFEALKAQNEELLNGLRTLQAAQTKPQEEKSMSKEEFAKLLTDDPEAAFAYSIKKQLNAGLGQIDKNLSAKQQATYYDQKAEADFPLMTKDAKFQALVKSETQTLVKAGMPSDSPMLVYIAAEKAALKYGPVKENKTQESKGSSGEAPTNITKKADNATKLLPKNFDKMAAMFNLNDKAKEKFKENLVLRAEQEAKRKG